METNIRPVMTLLSNPFGIKPKMLVWFLSGMPHVSKGGPVTAQVESVGARYFEITAHQRKRRINLKTLTEKSELGAQGRVFLSERQYKAYYELSVLQDEISLMIKRDKPLLTLWQCKAIKQILSLTNTPNISLNGSHANTIRSFNQD